MTSKLYYCENLLEYGKIERFYILETEFGQIIEMTEDNDNIYDSWDDFKKLWYDFEQFAILVEL